MSSSWRLRGTCGFLAALLFASTGSLRAQTITGTVSSSSRPVAGVTVRLLELERIVRTGSGGRFTFTDVPKGTYRVFAAAQGFASVTDTVQVNGEMATVSIELRASPTRLEDVVVSAAPEPGLVTEQFQSTATKTRADILASPGTSFAEKISDLPGVAMRGNGSAPNRPILRGLGDNEVLVLEDGLRMGDLATFDPAHATPIDALSIAQVDVVRGPATILYGPSTIGGVVNVITNVVPEVSDRRVSGTLVAEGNSGADQTSGYFDNVFSGEHQAFKVSAGGVHGSNIRIPSRTYIDPGSGAEFDLDRAPQTFDRSWEAGAGYAYQGSFGTIGLGGKHFETNYGIPGDPPNPDFETVPPTTSRIQQGRNTLELRSLLNVGSRVLDQVRVSASYNYYLQSEFPTAQDETGVSDPQANHFRKQTTNAVVQFQQQPWGRLRGTLGLWSNIENLEIKGDQPLGPNSVTVGLAGYAFEELVLSPSARLQAGLRYDYNKIQTHPYGNSTDSVFQTLDTSRLSNAVTASLGAVQRFDAHLTGSISAARSFRAPTVQELFANGLDAASGTYSVGTSTLHPETGYGVDASLRGTYVHAAFELSPFVNYIHDYIYGFLRGDTIEDFPVRQFAPTNARLFGFEAAVTVQPLETIALRAQADYVNAQDTRLDQPLPFTPPLRGLLRATYQNQRFEGLIEERMAARQSRLGDGDTPTPGYGITNIGVGVRFADGGLVHTIRLSCDNLFDQVYRDNLSVVKDFIPQPGRATPPRLRDVVLGASQIQPSHDRRDEHQGDREALSPHADGRVPAREVEVVEPRRDLTDYRPANEQSPADSVRLDAEIGQGARALGRSDTFALERVHHPALLRHRDGDHSGSHGPYVGTRPARGQWTCARCSGVVSRMLLLTKRRGSRQTNRGGARERFAFRRHGRCGSRDWQRSTRVPHAGLLAVHPGRSRHLEDAVLATDGRAQGEWERDLPEWREADWSGAR